MSEQLRTALGGNRDEIERAMYAAQQDLIPLLDQVRASQLLMAQARGILDLAGYWIPRPPLPGPSRPVTLHEAIRHVLSAHQNRPMTSRWITAEIQRRGLYLRKDGTPPGVNDVSARISAYPALFRREDWRTCLRGEPRGPRVAGQTRERRIGTAARARARRTAVAIRP
jgi:HB1, ASXL, restriction endonuclease HTH domain